GEKADVSVPEWTGRSVAASQSLLDVVLGSLDGATERAGALKSEALQALGWQFGFLLAALALAAGSFLAIRARVIPPLHAIRDGMVKLASGDLDVEVGYSERHDEIGALAGTLATFKENAVAKAKIEEEQAARRTEAMKRQENVAAAIKSFEGEIGG